MLGNAHQLARDGVRRQHKIHAARVNRAGRHAIVLGAGILGKGDAALGLDRFQSEGAVGGRARQHHANGAIPGILSQRAEEMIDHAAKSEAWDFARHELQSAVDNTHAARRRNHIHMIGLDCWFVVNLHDRHLRGAREDFRQGAGMRWRQMLHQHERHAGIHRQRFEQLRERFQPASGRANADDRERRSRCGFTSVFHDFPGGGGDFTGFL